MTVPREPRSRGRQTTFARDLTDRTEIDGELGWLARGVAGEVVPQRCVTRVFVTVRTSSFFTRTLARTLPAPSCDVAEIERAALVVLDRFTLTRPVRLLGVRLELRRGG